MKVPKQSQVGITLLSGWSVFSISQLSWNSPPRSVWERRLIKCMDLQAPHTDCQGPLCGQ